MKILLLILISSTCLGQMIIPVDKNTRVGTFASLPIKSPTVWDEGVKVASYNYCDHLERKDTTLKSEIDLWAEFKHNCQTDSVRCYEVMAIFSDSTIIRYTEFLGYRKQEASFSNFVKYLEK